MLACFTNNLKKELLQRSKRRKQHTHCHGLTKISGKKKSSTIALNIFSFRVLTWMIVTIVQYSPRIPNFMKFPTVKDQF